jgi:hypothetical protein
MSITPDEQAAFSARTKSLRTALEQQILTEAAAEFGPRFPTVEVHFPRGRKTRSLPVEAVWAELEYDGSGPPDVVLFGRCAHPETGETMTVFLHRVGYGF